MGDLLRASKLHGASYGRGQAYPRTPFRKVIRHTMATELRAAGVSAEDIQGMLGHRAYGGITDVYAKYRPDYMADAVRAIDAYMGRLRVSCVLANKIEDCATY